MMQSVAIYCRSVSFEVAVRISTGGFVLPDFLVHKLALNLTVTFEMLEDAC